MAVTTKEVVKRRRFVRNPERVDQIVLDALQKLREENHQDEFKASADTLLEKMDKRLKMRPSRITIYRSLNRLAETGAFKMQRGKGKRARYSYKFGEAPKAEAVQVSASTPSTSNGDGVAAKVRALVDHERFLMERNAQLEHELREIHNVLQSVA